MYNIGGSREMHLDCNGTGGPTVVFLHQLGGQAYDWYSFVYFYFFYYSLQSIVLKLKLID